VFTVRSTVFTVHSTAFTVHSTAFTVRSTTFVVYSMAFIVHSTAFALHSARNRLHPADLNPRHSEVPQRRRMNRSRWSSRRQRRHIGTEHQLTETTSREARRRHQLFGNAVHKGCKTG
jgi:hypothetical protein